MITVQLDMSEVETTCLASRFDDWRWGVFVFMAFCFDGS